MALTTVFAASTNPQPGQLDTNFNQVGAMQVVACTAAGTNAISLNPIANEITIGSYAKYQQFGFAAIGASTGAVTIQVGALTFLNLYLADGTTQAGSGNISSGVFYVIVYNSALNGGAGGFQMLSQMPVSTLLDLLSANQGSVFYRDVSAWKGLSAGANTAQFQTGGPSANPFWSVIGGAQIVRSISFTSAGAFSFSSASGIGASTVVKITLIGGGGGAGGDGAAGNGSGGGGAGALAIGFISGLSANTLYSGTVGKGGNGSKQTATGSSGGTTTISFGGPQFTAGGGSGGVGNTKTGAAGGTASNTLILITGANGWDSTGTEISLASGPGGAGPLRGAGAWRSVANSAGGNNATGPGSGGGGASGGSTITSGGAGATGLFLMEWIQ